MSYNYSSNINNPPNVNFDINVKCGGVLVCLRVEFLIFQSGLSEFWFLSDNNVKVKSFKHELLQQCVHNQGAPVMFKPTINRDFSWHNCWMVRITINFFLICKSAHGILFTITSNYTWKCTWKAREARLRKALTRIIRRDMNGYERAKAICIFNSIQEFICSQLSHRKYRAA